MRLFCVWISRHRGVELGQKMRFFHKPCAAAHNQQLYSGVVVSVRARDENRIYYRRSICWTGYIRICFCRKLSYLDIGYLNVCCQCRSCESLHSTILKPLQLAFFWAQFWLNSSDFHIGMTRCFNHGLGKLRCRSTSLKIWENSCYTPRRFFL